MLFLKLAIGWILYFGVHSLLAADRVKATCRAAFPALFPFYRILYNLVAIGGLFPLAAWTFSDQQLFFQPTTPVRVAGGGFLLAGLFMLTVAFSSFNVKEFIGLRTEAQDPGAKLVTSGVYRYVRHPLYTGVFLLLPGLFLCRPTGSVVIFILAAIIYIEIGSRLEEKKLIGVFGKDYTEYRQTAKRYFPFLY